MSRPRFTDNGNGTVTDNRTGLIWLRDADCFDALSWADAQSAARKLASGRCGLTDGSRAGDWRMPAIDELLSLLDYRFVPALSNAAGTGPSGPGNPFRNLVRDSLYWSGTAAVQPPHNLAWEVALGNGNLSNDLQTALYHALPVRGPVRAAVTPRFKDNGDGTVTDNATGLVWLKNASCLGMKSWHGAMAACAALHSGACGLADGSRPGDWRLSTIQELESVIDFRFEGLCISNAAGTGQWTEGDAFDGILQSNLYWSSTTYAGNAEAAWVAIFNSGNVSMTIKVGYFYVWPVRGRAVETARRGKTG